MTASRHLTIYSYAPIRLLCKRIHQLTLVCGYYLPFTALSGCYPLSGNRVAHRPSSARHPIPRLPVSIPQALRMALGSPYCVTIHCHLNSMAASTHTLMTLYERERERESKVYKGLREFCIESKRGLYDGLYGVYCHRNQGCVCQGCMAGTVDSMSRRRRQTAAGMAAHRPSATNKPAIQRRIHPA